MKLRVVLTTAPVSLTARYGTLAKAGSTEPAFGVLCLASVAREYGAEVSIVESSAYNLSVEESVSQILKFNPDVVGFSCTTTGIMASAELARKLKNINPNIITIVGGCHVSAIPEETIREFPEFDAGVVGEGERTFVSILKSISEHKKILSDINGTVVRTESGICVNSRQSLIKNLDELPFPAWTLLPGFPYSFRPSPARIKRKPCASIVLTRGCPNRCTFCDRSVFGNRCRSYSPEYAVAMLKDLRNNYGVKEILIEDDTFIIVSGWVEEFCERLITEKIDITWSCLGRADRVTPELLNTMRRAGCWHISYGIESGDAEILRRVNKNLTLEQIQQAVHYSHEVGLRVKGFFMVGFPGETTATLEATRNFALSLQIDEITVMHLTPFPGSELYRTAEQWGHFERDWRKMNTLEIVFIPNGLTETDLRQATTRLLRTFYLRPRIIWNHAIYALRNPAVITDLLRGFFALMKMLFTSKKSLRRKRSLQ